jgi:hypothetical protein
VVDGGHPVAATADRHQVKRPARLVEGERRDRRRIGQLDVAQDRPPGVRRSREGDPSGGADCAPGAVAAHRVGGSEGCQAIWRAHVEVDAVRVRPDAGDGVLSQIRNAQLGQVVLEQFLGAPLRQEQRVGVAGVEERKVQPALQQREMRGGHRGAFGQPSVRDAAHRELLKGARVDRERLGVRRSRRAPLKNDRPYPAAAQFGREPHAHGAAADDGDVVTVHP